ncbi:hypothetical protein ACIP5T_03205 [Microbacterium sp. NPDC088619]|uniref:hypothetical protein n=1 Tax=Microbacterium sp. NPDC088619 TaxID=3364196 RepID=UPI0037F55B8E
MNADIITDLDYPHGTADGFKQGCNTSHCPSEVTCRTVHTRLAGDWAFRRQFESGMTPLEIVTLERKQAQEAAEAAQTARKARPGVRASGSPEDRLAAANKARSDGLALIPRHTLRELLNQGLTDREIADKLGLTRRQVTGTRGNAGWERNPDRKGRTFAKTAPAKVGAES